ncbi:TetR/AcrR family transcriptional regulator [Curtobacterium sp. YC1]|uniref:TetR/AcrR family transcriptional regulator n=1 Tax=Curtobacterium sp. YC1 TaxID=2795488 RepID=UPI0018E579EC|nr:TetR/AcrR family transcriptional regulator [Curtobacterium sp. YC1]QQD76390.1 TetR/AcrR family transcriptional regulator [Curtobacterium sp. YC1]
MKSSQPAPVRVRNARGDGARLRQEIVDAATGLLQSGDAETVTLRAIARAAGITAPSIYRHFESVDAVLRTVVEDTFAELEDVLRQAQAGSTGEQQVWAVSRAYLAFADEHPGRYRLLFGGAWNAADLPGDAHRERAERSQLGQGALQVLVEAMGAAAAERAAGAASGAGAGSGSGAASDGVVERAVALWVGLHGLASLRRTTPLFPWPEAIEERVIRSSAGLGG